MGAGYIYFVHAVGTDRYKIGLTNNLDRRMKELNGKQSPFENHLLWSIEVSDMRSAEKDLHQTFASRRVNGKWFEFSEDELQSIGNEYDRVSNEYPVQQYHHAPAAQHEPDFSQTYGDRDSGSWWMAASVVGVALSTGLLFAAVQGKLKIPTISTATYATTTQRANVRAVPNGKIICVLEARKQIDISSADQSGWHKTTACTGRVGVIHQSVISWKR